MWMVYALAAAALWGLEYALLGRLFSGRLSPLTILALQMAVGAIFIAPLAIATGVFKRDAALIVSDPEMLRLTIVSALVFTLGSYMIATSISEGNALIAGLVEISYPLFIVVFLIIFGWNEPIRPLTMAGGILIFVGAAIVQYSI
jgi:drug/metabolite transporter (DMT)-like permease